VTDKPGEVIVIPSALDIDVVHLRVVRALVQAGRDLEAQRAEHRRKAAEIRSRYPELGPERTAAESALIAEIWDVIEQQLGPALGAR
jgi:hypothetical protein